MISESLSWSGEWVILWSMKRQVQLLIYVAVLSATISISLFHAFECGANPNVRGWFDVVWWWVVTSGTVGYGDVVPITWQGRSVAIFTIIIGLYIYTNMVAIIAQSVHALLERRKRGMMPVRVSGHIVLCEYTAVTDELIQWLPRSKGFCDLPVVIVSDLVNANPYAQHLFVYGVPISPAVLSRAGIQRARYVFVFANMRFNDPDVKTLHVAARVLRLNPGATVFVELFQMDHELLKDVPAGIIPVSSLELIRCALRHGRMDPNDWLKGREPAGTEAAPPA